MKTQVFNFFLIFNTYLYLVFCFRHRKVVSRANLLIYNLVLRPLVGQQRPRWQPRPRRPWPRLRVAVMAGVTYYLGRLQRGLARVLQQKPFLRAKCPSLVKLRSHCCYLTRFLVRAR